MKISNILIVFITMLLTVGCASSFTSISSTENPDEYFLTEVHQNFLVPPTSSLYKCNASNNKMNCTEVGN